MYPLAYAITNPRPLKLSVQYFQTVEQLIPIQRYLPPQYQNHPNQSYRSRTTSGTLSCTHFQGWPWSGQCNHFQGCLQTTDTSKYQGAVSGSKLQGWPVTNSCSYKIMSCFTPRCSPFWGTTLASRWTRGSVDEIPHSVAKFNYSITPTGFGGTNSDTCSLLYIRKWNRKSSKLC